MNRLMSTRENIDRLNYRQGNFKETRERKKNEAHTLIDSSPFISFLLSSNARNDTFRVLPVMDSMDTKRIQRRWMDASQPTPLSSNRACCLLPSHSLQSRVTVWSFIC